MIHDSVSSIMIQNDTAPKKKRRMRPSNSEEKVAGSSEEDKITESYSTLVEEQCMVYVFWQL